uniref:ATPase AAA-type core domain-containing protein n=1 Tax=viral metagenome TaxID=1070528 RepID=A0A6C0CQ43_9ZZZZ
MVKGDRKSKKKYNLRRKSKRDRTYSRAESSGSESDSDYTTGDEYAHDEDFDMKEYRNFLAKIFPSKYAEERADNTPSRKSRRRYPDTSDEERRITRKKRRTRKEINYKEESTTDDEPEENVILETTEKKKKNKSSKKRKSRNEEEEEESIEDTENDSEEYEEEVFADLPELMDEEGSQVEGGPMTFNIVFNGNSIGGLGGEEDEALLSEEAEEEGEEAEEDEEDEGEGEEKKKKKWDDTPENRMAIEKMRQLLEKTEKEEGKDSVIYQSLSKTLKNAENGIKKNTKKKDKKLRLKNTREFNKLMQEKNMMNDLKYFKEKLTLPEQKKVLEELTAVMEHCHIEKPYRLTLLDADIPPEYKAVAYKKINTLKYMEPGGGEYYKIKQWVDTFMQIPFGKYKNLPVTLHDNGPQECATFMENAKQTLDSAVYGMNDVKLQIMQMVGQWITNPKAMGTAIAIKGPMGTGKTTIVKEGISKVLGRDFAFLALGGATDSSFLEGHSYTYEGSTWGKIIDILVQSKSMNPVIFLDELDKVSDTPKGEEIIGILTHLTDTTQNSKFHDKYFSELDFDLSRALFIFSYNDEKKVNPILRDRMYRVETKGYDAKEKIVIANNYLLPKIREQVKFNEGDIIIPDEVMKYMIDHNTEGEKGVRNLKRCLEIIHTKLNLYRLMSPGTNLFESEMALQVEFPMTVTTQIVDKLIKKGETNETWKHLYI